MGRRELATLVGRTKAGAGRAQNRPAMSNPVRYFDLIREMKNALNLRMRLVSYASQHSIKAGARIFRTTVPIFRKWLRRYEAESVEQAERWVLHFVRRWARAEPEFLQQFWEGFEASITLLECELRLWGYCLKTTNLSVG